jgi:hypothetical protein
VFIPTCQVVDFKVIMKPTMLGIFILLCYLWLLLLCKKTHCPHQCDMLYAPLITHFWIFLVHPLHYNFFVKNSINFLKYLYNFFHMCIANSSLRASMISFFVSLANPQYIKYPEALFGHWIPSCTRVGVSKIQFLENQARSPNINFCWVFFSD